MISKKMTEIVGKGELFIHASVLAHCVPGNKVYVCVHTASGKYAEAASVEVKPEDFQYASVKLWDWYSNYFLAEVFLNKDREESMYDHAMDELTAFHQTPYMVPPPDPSAAATGATPSRALTSNPGRDKIGAVKRTREPSGKEATVLRRERGLQRIPSTHLSDEQYTLMRNGLIRLIVSCFPSDVLATLPMDPLFKQISLFPMMNHGYVFR